MSTIQFTDNLVTHSFEAANTRINALSIRADELVEAAGIIRSQLPHRNRIWIKSMASRDIGNDISRLVKDVQHVEKTGHRRQPTWLRAGDSEAIRRSRNTMGYQVRGKMHDPGTVITTT
jgi:hypothetical protein